MYLLHHQKSCARRSTESWRIDSVITELIQSKIQATNERLGKSSTDKGELTKNQEFSQEQFGEETSNVKKGIQNIDGNIKLCRAF